MPNMSSIKIRSASINDIATIRQLAHNTWPVSYKGMISDEQITYMLDLMYSTEALREQMELKLHRFFIAGFMNEDVGFASFSYKTDKRYRLEKLYVLPTTQGRGAGKAMLLHVRNEVKRLGATVLELTVNRNNKSRYFYEKLGFVIASEIVMDIGSGWVMDDYIMELKV